MLLSLDYQKVAVFGFSRRTGLALVKYLSKFNLEIIVVDSKAREELETLIAQVDSKNITFDLGGSGDKILKSDLIILSPGVPYDLAVLKAAREKGIETISEVEFAFRQSDAEIIGITGTNGKTTTTEMLGAMMSDLDGKKVEIAGNIGIPFISIIDQLQAGEKVILELSSFQLEAVKKFRARTALYLNYSPDHLDRHHNEFNYKKAKKNIFLNQKENDYAIIDLDDPYLYQLKEELEADVIGLSSKMQDADLIIDHKRAYYQKDNVNLLDFRKIDLPGEHNRKNAAFAALAAYLAGQSLEKIQMAAAEYKLQSHRMEYINNKKGYKIIDDSKATNPDAAVKALKSLDQDIILIAGGQDRNADFSDLASLIRKKVKTLILVGETAEKLALLFKNDELELIRAENMIEAAEFGVERLNQNNTLLLSPACPSWDMFASYKERGKIFKETVLKNVD
jgi:UDP-N-acetylmuramoylalanine--D-glutamate ligase